MYKFVFTISILLISSLILSNKESTFNSVKEKRMSILFIGNSLTYTNDLPALVRTEAKMRGIKFNTKMLAFANYAIEDHWNDGKVQKLIASKEFDYIILQQGPSSQAAGRDMLIESGKAFSALCNTNQTRLCFFMVWPSLKYYQTFDGVIQNYRDAANVNNALLLPVGEFWKNHFDSTGDFSYYSADRFHPSMKGSKIAAKVIVDQLLDDMKK